MLKSSDFESKIVSKGDTIVLKNEDWYNRNLLKGFEGVPNFFHSSDLIVTPAYEEILGCSFKVIDLDEEHPDGCVIDWGGQRATIPTWAIAHVE